MSKNKLFKLLDGAYEFHVPNCSYEMDPDDLFEIPKTTRFKKDPGSKHIHKRKHRKPNPYKGKCRIEDLY